MSVAAAAPPPIPVTPNAARARPYLGLSSFAEGDAPRFFGREDETRELERLVRRGPLTVLFGASGLGKSSLLRAGLFPQVRRDLFPLPVRLNLLDANRPLLHDLRDVIASEAKLHDVDVTLPPEKPGETVQDVFRGVTFWSEHHALLTPLLVLDQFEELFTLGDRQRSAAKHRFVAELGALLDPREARRPYDDDDDDDGPRRPEAPRPRVILALREDYLAQLEDLKGDIPAVMRNRYRLRALSGQQALDAVMKPAPELVKAAVAERIVRFVANEPAGAPPTPLEGLEIEPSLLSMICDELDAERARQGLREITDALALQSREEIIERFYTRCFEGLPDAVELRLLVEDALVTDDGNRTTIAVPTAMKKYHVTEAGIAALQHRRLVRIERRFAAPHVELIHDLVLRAAAAGRAERLRHQMFAERARYWAKRVAFLVGLVILGAVLIARDVAGARAKTEGKKLREILSAEGRQALLRDEAATAAQLLNRARAFPALAAPDDTIADIALSRAARALDGVKRSVQHLPGIACVRLGGDHRTLVTCGTDGTARTWQLGANAGAQMALPAAALVVPSASGWVLAVDTNGGGAIASPAGVDALPRSTQLPATPRGWAACVSPDDGGFAIWAPGVEHTLRVWVHTPLAKLELVIDNGAPTVDDAQCLNGGRLLVKPSGDPKAGLVLVEPDANAAQSNAPAAHQIAVPIKYAAAFAGSRDGHLVAAARRGRPGIAVWRRGSDTDASQPDRLEEILGPMRVQQVAIAGALLVTTATRPVDGDPRGPGAAAANAPTALPPTATAAPAPDAVMDPAADPNATGAPAPPEPAAQFARVDAWDLSTLHLAFSVERPAASATLARDGTALAVRSLHQLELWNTASWQSLLARQVDWHSAAPLVDVAPTAQRGQYAIAVADGPVARVYATDAMPAGIEHTAGRAPEQVGAWPIAIGTGGADISFDGTWAADADAGSAALPLNGSLRDLAKGHRGPLVRERAPDRARLAAWVDDTHVAVVEGAGAQLCFVTLPAVPPGRAPLPLPTRTCAPPGSGANATLLVADPKSWRVAVIHDDRAELYTFGAGGPTASSLGLPVGDQPIVAARFLGHGDDLVVGRTDGRVTTLRGGVSATVPLALDGITSIRVAKTGDLAIAHQFGVDIVSPDGTPWRHFDFRGANDAILAPRDGGDAVLWACHDAGCTAWDPTRHVELGSVRARMKDPRLTADGRSVETGDDLLLLPGVPPAKAPVIEAAGVATVALGPYGAVAARTRTGTTEIIAAGKLTELPHGRDSSIGPSFAASGRIVIPSGRRVLVADTEVWTGAAEIAALAWNRARDRFLAVDARLGAAIVDSRNGAVIGRRDSERIASTGSLAVFDPPGERTAVLVPDGLEVRTIRSGAVAHFPVAETPTRLELAGDVVLGIVPAKGLLLWSRPDAPPIALSGAFESAHLAADGKHLVALGGGTLSIWRTPMALAEGPVAFPATAFELEPTGQRILVRVPHGSGTDTSVRALDNPTLELGAIRSEPSVTAAISPGGGFILLPDQKRLYFVGGPASVRLPVHVVSYAFGGDGKYLVTLDKRGVLRRTSLDQEGETVVVRKTGLSKLNVTPGPIAPDGRTSARVTGGSLDYVWIWNGSTKSQPSLVTLPHKHELRLLADPNAAVSLAPDGTVTTWDLRTGEEVVQRRRVVAAAALGAEGGRILVTNDVGDAEVIGVTPTAIPAPAPRTLDSAGGPIALAAFDPTGRWLVIGRASGAVQAFDLSAPAGTPHASLDSHARPTAIAITDGNGTDPVAAIGRADGTVDLWSLSSEPSHPLSGHSGEVRSAAFDASGQWLATAASDGTVRAWSVPRRVCVTKLTPRADHVASTAVAFSSDATPALVSATEAGDLFVWDLFVPPPKQGPSDEADPINQLVNAWSLGDQQ